MVIMTVHTRCMHCVKQSSAGWPRARKPIVFNREDVEEMSKLTNITLSLSEILIFCNTLINSIGCNFLFCRRFYSNKNTYTQHIQGDAVSDLHDDLVNGERYTEGYIRSKLCAFLHLSESERKTDLFALLFEIF